MGLYNCLHPSYIENSRGQVVKVRCGHCAACTNAKSFDYTTQCEIESASHEYNFFVTLTYENSFLPLVRALSDGLGFTRYCPVSPNLAAHFCDSPNPYFAISHCSEVSSSLLNMYYHKFNLPEHLDGLIPVLDKVDLQLFIKRLRYYISKRTNEKIRYFACGEYGPVHYRPHYHLQLWCDDPETASIMGEAVHKAWKFGRVDIQIVKSSASSYVAGYINGAAGRSRLHGIKGLRPFVLHSTRLYGSFYTSEEEKIPEIEFDEIARATFAVRGRFREISPLRSFLCAFFPKCINYDTKCHYERLDCYTVFRRVQEVFGPLSVDKIASYLFAHPEHELSNLISSFTYDGKFCENTVKSILYTSRKFLRNCEKFAISSDYYLRCIEHFYVRQNYYLLTCQLSDQEDNMEKYGDAFKPYLLGYYDIEFERLPKGKFVEYSKPVHDFLVNLGLEPQFVNSDVYRHEDNPLFIDYSRFQRTIARDKVKHKKLNDLNNIFS